MPIPSAAATQQSTSDSASTSPTTAVLPNPYVFKTASSGIRSRTDCIIVLPVTNSSANITAADDGVDEKPDVADLRDLRAEPILLALRLRLGRRVGEQRVDLLRDLGGPARVVDLHEVQSHGAVGGLARLVEVVVVDPELARRHSAGRRAIRADDLEVPALGPVLARSRSTSRAGSCRRSSSRAPRRGPRRRARRCASSSSPPRRTGRARSRDRWRRTSRRRSRPSGRRCAAPGSNRRRSCSTTRLRRRAPSRCAIDARAATAA